MFIPVSTRYGDITADTVTTRRGMLTATCSVKIGEVVYPPETPVQVAMGTTLQLQATITEDTTFVVVVEDTITGRSEYEWWCKRPETELYVERTGHYHLTGETKSPLQSETGEVVLHTGVLSKAHYFVDFHTNEVVAIDETGVEKRIHFESELTGVAEFKALPYSLPDYVVVVTHEQVELYTPELEFLRSWPHIKGAGTIPLTVVLLRGVIDVRYGTLSEGVHSVNLATQYNIYGVLVQSVAQSSLLCLYGEDTVLTVNANSITIYAAGNKGGGNLHTVPLPYSSKYSYYVVDYAHNFFAFADAPIRRLHLVDVARNYVMKYIDLDNFISGVVVVEQEGEVRLFVSFYDAPAQVFDTELNPVEYAHSIGPAAHIWEVDGKVYATKIWEESNPILTLPTTETVYDKPQIKGSTATYSYVHNSYVPVTAKLINPNATVTVDNKPFTGTLPPVCTVRITIKLDEYWMFKSFGIISTDTYVYRVSTDPDLNPDVVEFPRIYDALIRTDYLEHFTISGMTEGIPVEIFSNTDQMDFRVNWDGNVITGDDEWVTEAIVTTGDKIEVRWRSERLSANYTVLNQLIIRPAMTVLTTWNILKMGLDGVSVQEYLPKDATVVELTPSAAQTTPDVEYIMVSNVDEFGRLIQARSAKYPVQALYPQVQKGSVLDGNNVVLASAMDGYFKVQPMFDAGRLYGNVLAGSDSFEVALRHVVAPASELITRQAAIERALSTIQYAKSVTGGVNPQGLDRRSNPVTGFNRLNWHVKPTVSGALTSGSFHVDELSYQIDYHASYGDELAYQIDYHASYGDELLNSVNRYNEYGRNWSVARFVRDKRIKVGIDSDVFRHNGFKVEELGNFRYTHDEHTFMKGIEFRTFRYVEFTVAALESYVANDHAYTMRVNPVQSRYSESFEFGTVGYTITGRTHTQSSTLHMNTSTHFEVVDVEAQVSRPQTSNVVQLVPVTSVVRQVATQAAAVVVRPSSVKELLFGQDGIFATEEAAQAYSDSIAYSEVVQKGSLFLVKTLPVDNFIECIAGESVNQERRFGYLGGG